MIGGTMRRIKILILMSAVAIIMAACTKNTDSTITLLGKEDYIDAIINVIPTDLINEFDTRFGIQRGNIPPNIEGEFVLTPKKRVYSSLSKTMWPLDIMEPDMKVKFDKQNNRVAEMYHYEQYLNKIDTIYVMGKDNRFTAYYIENRLYDYGIYDVKIKRGVLFTGRIENDGISYFRYACIIMDVDNSSNGAIDTYPVGTFFIYEDGDGIARREDWYEEEGVK